LYTVGIEYATGHLLHISRLHAMQVQKNWVVNFEDGVCNWTHSAIQYVTCMPSAGCEVSCWQQQLECKWNDIPLKYHQK